VSRAPTKARIVGDIAIVGELLSLDDS